MEIENALHGKKMSCKRERLSKCANKAEAALDCSAVILFFGSISIAMLDSHL